MSELLQSGIHPDADQLNALVEHALPPHEREQTLAHLAACAGCRSIVALSLPAMEESPVRRVETAHKPWFSGWNLAWPAGAALAALVLTMLQIHNAASTRSETAARTEMGRSLPPVLPAPHSTASLPAARGLPAHAAAANAGGASVVPSAAVSAKPREGLSSGRSATSSIKSSDVAAVDSLSATPKPHTAQAIGVAGGMGMASGTGVLLGGGAAAGGVAGMAAAPPPAAAMARPLVQGQAMTTGAGFQAGTVSDSAYSATRAEAIGGFTLRAQGRAALPSGLPILSMASSGALVLALDTGDTLFLSGDDGRHWKPVSEQWKGRIVKVDLAASAVAASSGAGRGVALGGESALGRSSAGAVVTGSTAASSVAGTVTDATGAVISNASVVITDGARQLVRTAKTDSGGRYLVDGLTPGNYWIEVGAPGFEELEVRVALAASKQRMDNLKLRVGSVSETVTVQSAGAHIALESRAGQEAMPAAAPMQPTPLFEITTEAGDHWTSPDGQTWTHR